MKVNKYETIAQLIIPLAEYMTTATSLRQENVQAHKEELHCLDRTLGDLERSASFFLGKVLLTSYIVVCRHSF